MCLRTTKKRCEGFKKRTTDNFIYAYKVVKVFHDEKAINRIISQYNYFQWKPGFNKARGVEDYIFKEIRGKGRTNVYNGIHVFLTLKEAERFTGSYAYDLDYKFKVIKVKCLMKDFVAAGTRFSHQRVTKEAVFKKVYLSKKEYKNALQS